MNTTLQGKEKNYHVTRITTSQQMFNECCFASGVLTQKHYHWLSIEVTISHPTNNALTATAKSIIIQLSKIRPKSKKE